MKAVVIVHSGGTLESFYEGIRQSLNERYHQEGNSFQKCTISPEEQAEISALSAYAQHASDNLHVNGVHIERLIK